MPPEVATSRLISLFAGSVEALVPALVDPDVPPAHESRLFVSARALAGHSAQSAAILAALQRIELHQCLSPLPQAGERIEPLQVFLFAVHYHSYL